MSLRSIRRRFAALRKVPSQVSSAFADWLNRKIQENHDAGVDPFGEPWAELQPSTLAKGRTPPPLDETGAMRASALARPMQGSGVVVEYTDPKAGWAQDGAPNREPRMVLPSTMPPEWKAELDRIKREKIAGAR